MPPAKKYQADGGPTPAQIVALFRQSMPGRVAENSVWRFIDALIWNWLIAGTDAHAKNYSLLLARNEVRLAPLYDVASALPYGVHERELRLAMKVGDDYRVALFHNPWPKAARELSVERGALLARVRELTVAAPGAFAASAAAPGIAALGRELPGRLATMVRERAARCEAVLAAD